MIIFNFKTSNLFLPIYPRLKIIIIPNLMRFSNYVKDLIYIFKIIT